MAVCSTASARRLMADAMASSARMWAWFWLVMALLAAFSCAPGPIIVLSLTPALPCLGRGATPR